MFLDRHYILFYHRKSPYHAGLTINMNRIKHLIAVTESLIRAFIQLGYIRKLYPELRFPVQLEWVFKLMLWLVLLI